jgi:hypothetical protein
MSNKGFPRFDLELEALEREIRLRRKARRKVDEAAYKRGFMVEPSGKAYKRRAKHKAALED